MILLIYKKKAKYLVLFQISAKGSPKIGLSLNGTLITYSVVSNAGNSDTIGFSMIETTDTKYQLSVQNADTNKLSVNADPSHLIILQLA